MSRYDWDDLIKRWQNEALTPEQAIGQLLLWGQAAAAQAQQLQQQITLLESRLAQLERRILGGS